MRAEKQVSIETAPSGNPVKPEGMCQWYAACENRATHTRDAGPLGKVPICDRCAAKADEIEAG